MGPNFWRHPTNGLKKCSEKTRDNCSDHDDCCAVTACTYCLELEIYGVDIIYGVADQAANHWTGTVGGYAFDMYWERNYETGVCSLVVVFDGEEVYRKSCEDGQSCRDSSDEVEVVIGYPPETATLRWRRHEPLQLPHIDDPDTGCKTWFCGECDCSCQCLCVTITKLDQTIHKGEICNVNYDCEGPAWQGSVATYSIALELNRGPYGECVISGTIDGEEVGPVEVTGCKNLTASITLYDGAVVEVTCKICDCELTGCPCCPGWPLNASGIVHWSSIVSPSNDCDGGISEIDGDFGCPGGFDDVGTKIRFPSTDLWVRVFCEEGTNQWKAQYRSATSGGGFDPPASTVWANATGFDFVCPDCADAVDGIATGTIDFTAEMACETSGGIVTYSVLVHGDIEIGC